MVQHGQSFIPAVVSVEKLSTVTNVCLLLFTRWYLFLKLFDISYHCMKYYKQTVVCCQLAVFKQLFVSSKIVYYTKQFYNTSWYII